MRLTPAGGMFRRHAQTILNAAAEARAELAMADLSGADHAAAGDDRGFRRRRDAPPAVSVMADDLKGCQFLLETGASHRLLDQLDGRALDIVVAADLGAETAGGDWREVHPLLSEPFVVAAPQGTVDAGGDVAAQLLALPLIQYTARHLMGRQIAAHLARQNLRLAHRFELDSYHAILAMVAGGAGLDDPDPAGAASTPRAFRDGGGRAAAALRAAGAHDLAVGARPVCCATCPRRWPACCAPCLQAQVVDPAVAGLPWLKDDLRVL